MHVRKAELTKLAVNKEQYPKDDLFEIAFAGRSNVGKSSLLNTLIKRKSLARTSNKPGKTRTINFYTINESFRFIDLPGYGFARVSKKERGKWASIIEEYLENRMNLIEVILLLDIRHEPGEHDKMMYDWIKSYGYNGIIIGTKADKIPKTTWEKQINTIGNSLNVENKDLIIPYSATKKINVAYIWEIVEEIIKVNKKQQSH
ncbi:MAG TPA: ribosome biogenesis GTP-binding protein YihA/YsxC [Tissierellales bacterium]|nr:ribosome biogenesis GTP-binding protein YihA/YsxC [Tissierellales bacterium]